MRIKWFGRKAGKQRSEPAFPPDYTDLHCHLLPGLDDGAPDPETALELIGKMGDLGVRHFICTPHVMDGMWMNSSEKILHTLNTFRPLVDERFGGAVTLRAAAEYMIDEGFDHLIRTKDLLPLWDNLVLVEMSFVAPPIQLYSTLAELQVAGYQPVLAHPERYFFYHADMEAYRQLRETGCLFQLNLLSLGNYYGKDVRRTAEKLLTEGMYDLTGSDLHHHRHLSYLQKLVETGVIRRKVGELLKKNLGLGQ